MAVVVPMEAEAMAVVVTAVMEVMAEATTAVLTLVSGLVVLIGAGARHGIGPITTLIIIHTTIRIILLTRFTVGSRCHRNT